MATQNDYIILQELLEGREKMLGRFYQQYRTHFLNWARAQFSSVDDDNLMNAYQEAMTVLYENIINKKLTQVNLTAPLINYIIGIGNHQLLKTLNKNKKTLLSDDISSFVVENMNNFLDEIFEEEYSEEQKQKLKAVWEKLSPQCKKCLDLFYTHKHTIDEIREIMAFTNKATVSAHKSRCLAKLRELMDDL